MLSLTSFQRAYLFNDFEIEIKEEIFSKYKYALAYIGVDLTRADVQEALLNCIEGFEDAIRATIAYWYWLTENQEPFYANASLIQAIGQRWSSRYWKDEYLDNPNFKSPGQVFWEEAGRVWGTDFRNQIIADVNEDYILLRTGTKVNFCAATRWGWERLREYVLEEKLEAIERSRRRRQILR
ncbi:hypothetical protein G7B40_037930 [Aetokthonos hydrillicola Thurmond2011]|jgi:hypothetical protein|uniref:Uncharacterized protein n=1 Tax=Aetokthonos hydrillicola Thurmond2011 TaxID=2712845 RepID=A0AAP5ME31_9CYAN|nr:hypothetical protein [Aetokthonos hydrillicola]MBO3464131.1 hypothetical protein [Aetokthonos hydrillicola CCALA 1050]MBW4589794.1 hypothetical protein [Aetokthonos hydrillicola CCALA 1050]MDR9900289.1 hypothetical protein [Aetokthonos hydrillicola Thurmond2011]